MMQASRWRTAEGMCRGWEFKEGLIKAILDPELEDIRRTNRLKFWLKDAWTGGMCELKGINRRLEKFTLKENGGGGNFDNRSRAYLDGGIPRNVSSHDRMCSLLSQLDDRRSCRANRQRAGSISTLVFSQSTKLGLNKLNYLDLRLILTTAWCAYFACKP
jgi:hypothetical protein